MEHVLDPKTPDLPRSPRCYQKPFIGKCSIKTQPLLPRHLLLAKMLCHSNPPLRFKLPPSHLSTDQDAIHRKSYEPSRCVSMLKVAKVARSTWSSKQKISCLALRSNTKDLHPRIHHQQQHTLKITHRIGSVGHLLYPYVSKGCSGVALPNVS